MELRSHAGTAETEGMGAIMIARLKLKREEGE
jgi:hypothetical protein